MNEELEKALENTLAGRHKKLREAGADFVDAIIEECKKMKTEIKKKLWKDKMPTPICIEVDHTVEGHVVIRKNDWELILNTLRENNEVHEVDNETN